MVAIKCQHNLVSGDLSEDYASYIASRLNRQLMADEAASAERLRDHYEADQAAHDAGAAIAQAQGR